MRQYGCLKAIPLSFYSRDLYRDVSSNWAGSVVLYLLLLLALCWALLSVHIQRDLIAGYAFASNKFIPQIPVMVIKNGEIKTPEHRPYLIKNPDDKDHAVFAIIDTTGKYTNLDNSDASILITKNTILYKHENKVKVQPISSTIELDIKPVELQQSIGFGINWMWVFFLPILIGLSFIYRVVVGALYAVVGKLFAVIAEIPLTYGQILKISILAMTPAIILSTGLSWFSITFYHEWLVYFVLTVAYLIFGINANKKGK